jgi:hypothetical protein
MQRFMGLQARKRVAQLQQAVVEEEVRGERYPAGSFRTMT